MSDKKLVLKVSAQVHDRCVYLKEMRGFSSMVKVFSNALVVYDYLWQQKNDGCRIVIRDANGHESDLDLQ